MDTIVTLLPTVVCRLGVGEGGSAGAALYSEKERKSAIEAAQKAPDNFAFSSPISALFLELDAC
jgi:hypothetical protein